jgi:hypothetical protein
VSAPKVGDRTTDEKPLEFTGSMWAPVCPPCDKPMDAHDEHAKLCCGTCGLRAVDR